MPYSIRLCFSGISVHINCQLFCPFPSTFMRAAEAVQGLLVTFNVCRPTFLHSKSRGTILLLRPNYDATMLRFKNFEPAD